METSPHIILVYKLALTFFIVYTAWLQYWGKTMGDQPVSSRWKIIQVITTGLAVLLLWWVWPS